MLCYRAVGTTGQTAQKLYLRFKADESVDQITGLARRADPDANRERQPIQEHISNYIPLELQLLCPSHIH